MNVNLHIERIVLDGVDLATGEQHLLRQALASSVPCPRKYRRCRDKDMAATKSIECPLKFPRCRKGRGQNSRLTQKAR